MASLTAHLREPNDHGRLAFHPECPICRGRLAGMPADAVVSRRTQALVAAGVLALSSGTPAAALAQSPDREEEGLATPYAVPDDQAVSPDFDPGGATEDLPSDVGAEMQPAPVDDAVLPEEAVVESQVEVVSDTVEESDVVTSPAPQPAATPAPVEPQAAAPVSETPALVESEPVESEPAGPAGDGRHRIARSSEQKERAATPRPAAPVPSATATDTSTPVTYVTSTVETTQPQPTTSVVGSDRAARGDRFHVVQPGESLWSIARDLRGRDASVAAVAREVNRLWELNGDRIGTGDPDLLTVGTKLLLR